VCGHNLSPTSTPLYSSKYSSLTSHQPLYQLHCQPVGHEDTHRKLSQSVLLTPKSRVTVFIGRVCPHLAGYGVFMAGDDSHRALVEACSLGEGMARRILSGFIADAQIGQLYMPP